VYLSAVLTTGASEMDSEKDEGMSETAGLIRKSNGYKIAFAGILVLIAAVLLMVLMIIVTLITSEHYLLIPPIVIAGIGLIFVWVGVVMITAALGKSKTRMFDPSYVRTINRYIGEDIRSALHFGRG
jgi:threonine/homoserine/homoserine lactone efflux protein